MAPSPVYRFENTMISLTSLGQIAGLIGFSLFAINLILSARLKILDHYFFGLNQVYKYHAQIGKITLVLLLLHPLFLLANSTGGLWIEIIRFFLPNQSRAINAGIFSLTLLIGLLALTLFLRPRYDIWKWTHKFLGGVFIFAFLHVFLIPSDVSSFFPLRIYLLGMGILALSLFFYSTVFGKWLRKKYIYQVSLVQQVAKGVWQVIMEPMTKQMPFLAGQFIFVNFENKNIRKESHPFSLTSNPHTNNLSLVIKGLGDYTKQIHHLSPGTTAFIEGPFGSFSYKNALFKQQIWIAGGIGITPFLSMIQEIQHESRFEYMIDLYYCIHDENEFLDLACLKELPKNIRLIAYYSDRYGFITADYIEKQSGSLQEKDIFLCAPPVMIQLLKKQFQEKGVLAHFLHSEEFIL